VSETPDASPLAAGRVLLIVTDNPAHRLQFNRHFQEAPYHLVFAVDGEDGFDRFHEARPHLVIAHVSAGQLDGTLLCQLLRQQPRGDQVPMLLVGEELSDPDLAWARAVAAGADDTLAIPVSTERLLERVEALLAGARPLDTQHEVSERPPIGGRGDAEVAFGSVLEDFVSQLEDGAVVALEDPDHAAGRGAEVEAETHLETPLQRPPSDHGQGGDMDTVVSFKNPFFEADLPTALPLDTLELPGVAVVSGGLGLDEPVTPVGRRPDEPWGGPAPEDEEPEEPVTRVGADLLGPAPVTELAASPSGSIPALSPALARPLSDDLTQEPARDPLEEPKITSSTASGVRPRPVELAKAGLIQEVPRELTPSGVTSARRASQVAKRAPAGQRRGLDESQLGKRLSKRVRTLHRLLEEVDYYQLLGVERTAEQADLQRAYFDLSLEFHPDRFFLLRSGDLKEKIYFIYRRIAEAYQVLSDEERRRAYDEARNLHNQKRAAPELRGATAPASMDAQPSGLGAVAQGVDAGCFVELAREAYDAGDLNGARLHLTLAQLYERDNATVRAALRVVVGQLAPSL
jgi:CheY-like chemotaxis protein